MTDDQAIELARGALWMALVLCTPALIVALVVGLVVGLLQALTQIQEQTLSFVPKLLALLLTLSLALPWLVGRMLEYTQTLITQIPEML